MSFSGRKLNLVLSGGGIKGIAYIGVCEEACKNRYSFKNISGVSAGALVGSFMSAGYSYSQLRDILDEFDFTGIKINEEANKLPVVANYLEYLHASRSESQKSIEKFLNIPKNLYTSNCSNEDCRNLSRGNFFDNITTFSKEGCLFDGDYLEEWVYKVLLKRGIKRFADLRGGIKDKVNPRGYKMRMTAVDANRGKIIVLPDDMVFYGIDPDSFEVSKAVRMSTSVPFAFKPVEIVKKEGKYKKIYNIVDGGVLDNFPFWIMSSHTNIPTVGFRLDGGAKKKFFSLSTPLNILKSLISAVHDIGKPEETKSLELVGNIDTGDISFLDFNLDQQEKDFIYNAGKNAAQGVFAKLARNTMKCVMRKIVLPPIYFRRRFR